MARIIKVAKGQSFRSYLKDNAACSKALAWVGKKSMRSAWRKCPQGDWMVWLLGLFGFPIDALWDLTIQCFDARAAAGGIHPRMAEGIKMLKTHHSSEIRQYAEKYPEVFSVYAGSSENSLRLAFIYMTKGYYLTALGKLEKEGVISTADIVRARYSFDDVKAGQEKRREQRINDIHQVVMEMMHDNYQHT